MNVLLGAVLCAEAVVLVYELPNHPHLVLHVVTWITLILLPFTIFAILARTSWGARRWPRRLVVRPFVTLKTSPKWSGAAIASLMDRQIGYWLSDKFNKSNGGSGSPASPTLSLGWISLPWDWLWNWTRGLIAGCRDLYIDGLVVDDEGGMWLQAWVSETVSTWEERVADGPVAESLNDATAKLAFRILEELEPITVAVFHSMRWRDDDAIRLMTRSDDLSEGEKLILADAYLSAERLSRAGALIEDLCCFLKEGADRLDVKRMEATLRMKQGRFQQARDLLKEIVTSPSCEPQRRCEVLRLIAEAFAQEYRLDEAIASYDQVLIAFFAETGKLLGRKWREDGEELGFIREVFRKAATEMTEETKRAQLGDILATARQATGDRARCWMLLALAQSEEASEQSANEQSAKEQSAKEQRETAISDLRLAIEFHNLWTEFVSLDTAVRDSSAATLTSTLAQTLFAKYDLDETDSAVGEAIGFYEQAPPSFEQDLREDELNMSAQASLAWCYFGRSAAWRLHTKLHAAKQESPLDGEKHAEAQDPEMNADPDGLVSLAFAIHSLPAAERRTVEQLYDNALQREPGLQRNVRLWKTAEVVAAWKVEQDGARVVKLVTGSKTAPTNVPDDFKEFSITSPRLQEAQKKADLEDDEVIALVRLLSLQLSVFTERNAAEDKSGLDQLWAGVEADVTAKQAEAQFLKLGNGDRRAQAEAAYGRACLAAILGLTEDAAGLLMAADQVAGEGTFAYRNRAALDKDFDWVRLEPAFRQVTGWPAAGAEIKAASGKEEVRATSG